MKIQTIQIGGMTCINCQHNIENKLKELSGVEEIAVDYVSGTAKITYDEAVIALNEINSAIESQGYTISERNKPGKTALKIIGVLVIILALSSLLRMFSISSIAASFPLVQTGMGYGMMLVIGLLTSVHCIAMCGGINLSQTLGRGNVEISGSLSKTRFNFSLLFPGVLYNSGRLISYTAVGVVVGALGSVITVSGQFRNIVFLIAGIFMIIMGINMLGLFPALTRFTPRLPQFLSKKIGGQKAGRGPLVVGILNGFMPCGPLQAMQVYALSTANPIAGGISMFLFCLGTIPLMFTLGAAGGILTSVKGMAFSQKAMQAGAVLVAAMGVVMFTNGWDSVGFARPLNQAAFVSPASPQIEGGALKQVSENNVQIVQSTLLPNRYPAITVQQGIPVRWIINAPQGSINGCNNRITISEYKIQHTFRQGENVIEFLPERTGIFRYACWMSMIHSTITVLAPGESMADEKEKSL